MKKKKLVVIGAGPKALTLVAKAKALETTGWNVPEIIIIEKTDIGANWNGQNGYTNGDGVLGISPLKTINFPPRSIFGDEIVEKMDEYSFIQYLTHKGTLDKWVDGGMSWITHKEFSEYLKWVSSDFQKHIRYGKVTNVRVKKEKWSITYETAVSDFGVKSHTILADGLVFTGPGKVNNPFSITPNGRFIYDGKDWWKNERDFVGYEGKIALIGGGISAGSIFEFLMPKLSPKAKVDWYTRRGIFTRSENFVNNQRFSNTNLWQQIPPAQRRSFIKATDRGSIDSSTHAVMSRYTNQFSEVIGEIESLQILDWGVGVSYTDGLAKKHRKYDKVIISTGFCNTDFVELMSPALKKFLSRNNLESLITPDLSVQGLSPTLHLPMLAGFNIGIGCSILSSLGEMSDRILSAWVSNTLPDSAKVLEIKKQGKKGEGLFAVKGFSPENIIVTGRPLHFTTERTKTSVQVGIDLHMEPSYHFVKANHSCTPNCGIRLNEFGGYSLVAIKWIRAGEEITWDYAMSEWESIAVKKGGCQCGSKNCRGDIGGYKNLPTSTKERYKGFTAPYLELFV